MIVVARYNVPLPSQLVLVVALKIRLVSRLREGHRGERRLQILVKNAGDIPLGVPRNNFEFEPTSFVWKGFARVVLVVDGRHLILPKIRKSSIVVSGGNGRWSSSRSPYCEQRLSEPTASFSNILVIVDRRIRFPSSVRFSSNAR